MLLSSLLFSCGIQEEKPPVEAKKMQSILTDIHLAEAYSSLIVTDSVQKQTSNKNIDSLVYFYAQILARHKTSVSQFEEALKWYSLHPQLLDTVYNNILPVFDSIKVKNEKARPK